MTTKKECWHNPIRAFDPDVQDRVQCLCCGIYGKQIGREVKWFGEETPSQPTRRRHQANAHWVGSNTANMETNAVGIC